MANPRFGELAHPEVDLSGKLMRDRLAISDGETEVSDEGDMAALQRLMCQTSPNLTLRTLRLDTNNLTCASLVKVAKILRAASLLQLLTLNENDFSGVDLPGAPVGVSVRFFLSGGQF